MQPPDTAQLARRLGGDGSDRSAVVTAFPLGTRPLAPPKLSVYLRTYGISWTKGSVRARVDFGILGPLSIRTSDAVVQVPAAKQRTVAAALILRANKHVAMDELADFLWDDRPPPGARGAVQAYVMRLRRALGERLGRELIRTVAGGYLLEVPPEAVDLMRFHRLVSMAERSASTGQLAAASGQLAEALRLWRGAPLSDVESELLRRSEIPMLVEQRLLAIERRIEIELALGHHQQVIPELRALVGEYPLRERYWYLLMLGLRQCGRRGDALAAYRRVWLLLTGELGIEPGRELRELHEAVLSDKPIPDVHGPAGGGHDPRHGPSAHDIKAGDGGSQLGARHPPVGPPYGGRPTRGRSPRHLGARSGVPPRTTGHPDTWVKQSQLPRDVSGFVGHTLAIEEIASALTSGDPAVPVVAISGPPGVGKTALATRVAHRVRSLFPDGQLYARLTGSGGMPRNVAAVLADLMIATGVWPGSIPAGLDQRGAAYRAWLADRRVLIFLDDAVQAAQVRPLLPGTPGCAVLTTSRNDMRGLAALDNALTYLIDVLEPSEALILLSRRLSAHRISAEPAAAAELAAACGYLPLALRIAAANLADSPGRTLGSYVADLRAGNRVAKLAVVGDPAAAVQAAFDISYAALDPTLRRLFCLLAQLPRPDFATGEVAALLKTDDSRAARLLDRLAAASLLRRRSGRFEFHNLLRLYAAGKAAEYAARAREADV